MERVQEFGRRIVFSRVSGILLAAVLGVVLVLTQKGQYQNSQTKVYASSLEATALNMVVKLPPPPPVNCQAEACVALTFDDGPDPATTPHILDVLEKEQATATFFVIGNRVAGHENILRRMHADGDEIGNHSWSHPNFVKLNPAQMLDQINATQSTITASGVPAPHLFRPPYGGANQTMLSTIHMPIILWNVDPKDWREKNPATLISTVESQAHNGSIIIMHDTLPTTVSAASQMIHDLKAKYHLVTVTQLLQLSPEAQGEFFGHPPH